MSNLSNYLSYNGFPQCNSFLINNKCKQPNDFLLERRGCEVDDNEKERRLELNMVTKEMLLFNDDKIMHFIL